MIGSVSANRRAHAFAHALDEQQLGEVTADDRTAGDGRGRGAGGPGAARGSRSQTTGSTPSGHGPAMGGGPEEPLLLALANELAALPRPELDPEVKTVQRARLIAAMETAFAEGKAGAGDEGLVPEQRGRSGRGAHRAPAHSPLSRLRPSSRLAKGLTAGGLGVGVAASAFGGVAAASTDALPGDTLYGLKRGMEDLKLGLAGDDADRGLLHLDHAATRLQEANRLMERGRLGELDHESLGEVRRALSGMGDDAAEGHRLLSQAFEQDGDLAPLRSLSSFSESHRAAWSKLRDRLPSQLSDVSDEVSSVFDAIDSEVGSLRTLLPDTGEDPPPQQESHGGAERTDEKEATPRPSVSPPKASEDRTAGGTREKPSPSGSGRSQEEGLLGGSGLLDLPTEDPTEEPAQPDSGSRKPPRSPEPDVTLPPIIPDVLPGLNGLSGSDRT